MKASVAAPFSTTFEFFKFTGRPKSRHRRNPRSKGKQPRRRHVDGWCCTISLATSKSCGNTKKCRVLTCLHTWKRAHRRSQQPKRNIASTPLIAKPREPEAGTPLVSPRHVQQNWQQLGLFFHSKHMMYFMSSVYRYHAGMVGEVVIDTLIASTSFVTFHVVPHDFRSTLMWHVLE